MMWVQLKKPNHSFYITVCSPPAGMNSLCVSQLLTRRLCVLLGPALAAHTPPARAGTVHLQDLPGWREAHWRKERCREEEKSSHFSFPSSFTLCQQSETESGLCFTWKGSVDHEAWQTCNFILSSSAVIRPITGLVYGDELDRTLAEEIFADNQFLNCSDEGWNILRARGGKIDKQINSEWHGFYTYAKLLMVEIRHHVVHVHVFGGGLVTHWSMLR